MRHPVVKDPSQRDAVFVIGAIDTSTERCVTVPGPSGESVSDLEVVMMHRNNRKYLAGGAALLLVAGLTGTVLAATNSVPASNAGQGVNTVAGFDVKNVSYNADPTAQGTGADSDADVVSVSFDIARAGANSAITPEAGNTQVFVQLRSGSTLSDWAPCKIGSGASAGTATCSTADGASIKVGKLDELSVVAYDV
jgi:hypothetical protein